MDSSYFELGPKSESRQKWRLFLLAGQQPQIQNTMEVMFMAFFTSAVTTLQTLVVALGAGLAVWGVINLLEGYGSDNPGTNAHG